MKSERKTYFNFQVVTILLLSGLLVFSFDLGLNQILPEPACYSEWILSDFEDSSFQLSVDNPKPVKIEKSKSDLFNSFDFFTFLFNYNSIQNIEYQRINFDFNLFDHTFPVLRLLSLSRSSCEPSILFLS